MDQNFDGIKEMEKREASGQALMRGPQMLTKEEIRAMLAGTTTQKVHVVSGKSDKGNFARF